MIRRDLAQQWSLTLRAWPETPEAGQADLPRDFRTAPGFNDARRFRPPRSPKRKLWRSGWVDLSLPVRDGAGLRRVIAQNATLAIFDLRSGSAAAAAIIATWQFQTGHTR